jgi:hypothetical protein
MKSTMMTLAIIPIKDISLLVLSNSQITPTKQGPQIIQTMLFRHSFRRPITTETLALLKLILIMSLKIHLQTI